MMGSGHFFGRNHSGDGWDANEKSSEGHSRVDSGLMADMLLSANFSQRAGQLKEAMIEHNKKDSQITQD